MTMARNKAAINHFAFQIHHILPRELFTPDRLDALKDLFRGQTISLNQDMTGNKIGLFANPGMAAMVQAMMATGNMALINAGLGGVTHNGGHPGYNKFAIDAFDAILKSDALAGHGGGTDGHGN
jgi:hypothetical protein